MLKSLDHAKLGALWGAGLYLCLWLGMIGTLGEILMLLPGMWILGLLGVRNPDLSIVWRGVTGVFLTIASSYIGARYGFPVYSVLEKYSRVTRTMLLLFLAVICVMIILIGRNLKM